MRSALVLATVLAACALFGVVAVGCLSKPRFECAGNADCLQGAIQGTCEPDSFCSFPDSSCPSGQRYGDLSGPQANQCVGVPIDAPPDAFVPDTYVHDARECFGGSGAYQICLDMMPPMGNVTLAGTLDTVMDPRCMAMPASWMTANQPDACLILGKSITIATTTVTGARPLVILGDTIAINGTLDVASHRGQPAGPGAPFASCTAFPQAPANNASGGGGGAGGSFKTKGGDGGDGKGGSLPGLAPPALAVNPTVLRAGCSGQTGGTGVAAAGAPGRGGGAVFLTASRITFSASGAINASGAGAVGGGNLSGGSGGGSGGMIVLHAAEAITGTTGAKLIANGGGAASGATAAAGVSGNDPSLATPTTPATGGDAGNQAGTGGAGFAGVTAATTGQSAGGARDTGGGGGGGGGFIQTNLALTNITSSPAATVVP